MVEQARLTRLERALLALILALSLFLRLTAGDVFVTTDEDKWYTRSLRFAAALREHNWRATYQSGHPGVITMWLGAAADRLPPLRGLFIGTAGIARGLLRAAAPASGVGLSPLTIGARGLVGLWTWLGLLALCPLLRRLFGPQVALLATALIALDPFFLAHSRLHHLDALLTTFVFLSIACLLVYRLCGRQPVYLAASAVAAALATANKSPGILLAPWAGATLLLPALSEKPWKRWQGLLRGLCDLALWDLIAALVFVAIWPAMWVSPLVTLRNVFLTAKGYAEAPHGNSNFFWFAVRPDPGPGFYPVAWAFRTTPWVLLGLVSLAAFWRERKERLAVALLALGALLFTAAMTVGEKKFDRYLLPVFPLLDTLAAVGWVALGRRWRDAPTPRWLPAVLGFILAAGQFFLLWPTRPYYISYYNPVLGGGKAASQVLLVGWGEGLDQAAAYLNARPDAANLLVGTSTWFSFQPFFRGRALRLGELPSLAEPDYYLIYSNAAQRGLPSEIAQYLSRCHPERVIAHNGIEYVRIYENTLRRQSEEALNRIAMQGDPERDLILLDADAALGRYYQGAVPLQVFRVPEREDTMVVALQELVTSYRRVWRLVYPGSPALSQAVTRQLAGWGTVGGEVAIGDVRAVRYDLPAGPQPAPLRPSQTVDARFGEQVILLGYDISTLSLTPGQPFRIRLYWQAGGPVAASYTVFVHLVDSQARIRGQADSLPQGGARCTDTWMVGEVVPDDHVLTVAPDAPPGEYTLLVGLYDLRTMQRLPASDTAGRPLPDNALRLASLTVVAQVNP